MTIQQEATNSNIQKNCRAALAAYLFPDRSLSHPQIGIIDLMLQGLADAQVGGETMKQEG